MDSFLNRCICSTMGLFDDGQSLDCASKLKIKVWKNSFFSPKMEIFNRLSLTLYLLFGWGEMFVLQVWPIVWCKEASVQLSLGIQAIRGPVSRYEYVRYQMLIMLSSPFKLHNLFHQCPENWQSSSLWHLPSTSLLEFYIEAMSP